jgi:hypothetical protein
VIVARTNSERYEWFKSLFADDPAVEVIFDRRQGERRQCNAPVQPERRQHDRRTRDISYELERLGYALVRREARIEAGDSGSSLDSYGVDRVIE